MKLIGRPTYLERLKRLRGTPDIKIITGVRRSGKSQLMLAFMEYVRLREPQTNIIFVDFTRLSSEPLREYHALHNHVEANTQPGRSNILLIDEVQMCPHFELAINSLHASGDYDIYLTGSNAFLLSADLATLFTGRFIELHVFPFSFKEYRAYFLEQQDVQVAFDQYFVRGGMAGSYPYTEEQERTDYLRDVYTTILTRDLVDRYRINDTNTLLSLSQYAMDNVGNTTSPNNIANVLVANKVPTSHVTIRRYLSCLCDAFLLYQASRYDISGKRLLESQSKYYLVDTGFRYAMLGMRNMDWGHVYENIVYIELLRREYRVYVGKLHQKEVDFVVMKGSAKAYIQVADNISSPDTFQRETEPLLRINDAYPKMLIARTRHPEYDYQGIRIVDLAEWLLA